MTKIFLKDLDFEIYNYHNRNVVVQFSENKMKQNESSEFEGTALRLIKNKRMVLVSGTKNISNEKLVEIADETLPYAVESNFSFRDFARFNQSIDSDGSFDKQGTFHKDAIEFGRALLDTLYKQKEFSDFHFTLSLKSNREKTTYENSSVDEKSFSRTYDDIVLTAMRVVQNDMLELSFISHDLKPIDGIGKWLRAMNFSKKLEISKNLETLHSGKYPVIFHPFAVDFILYSLIAALRLNNIQEKISPLRDKMNESILNEKITLIDDPFYACGSSRAFFDDEGAPCKKKFLVENGILKSYLSNLYYAIKNNMEPTGNGFKDRPWRGGKDMSISPGINPTNLIMPTNEKYPTFDEVIKDIKEGLLIELSFDCCMGNIVSGEIGGNIDLGYKIKDGKITGRVKNKRFTGNLYNLFGKQLAALTSSVEADMFGSGLFPYILSKDVSIT